MSAKFNLVVKFMPFHKGFHLSRIALLKLKRGKICNYIFPNFATIHVSVRQFNVEKETVLGY